MTLDRMGWNAQFEASFTSLRSTGHDPARVCRQDRERYFVLDAAGAEWPAEVSGRLRHTAAARAELPAVGDWVALRPGGHDGPRAIVAVLPRATQFTRKVAGETTEAQVVAANIDVVIVVAGLDGDFNPRRIERYVVAAWDSGAEPVVVLNKADLTDEVDARVADIEAVAPGVPVLAVSARLATGLDPLSRWLVPGRTLALLGSSGVGKSTLANLLLGEQRQETQDVRAGDARGRHTTTRRELMALPCGAWLIDTPGMRELQLWGGALEGAFPDIDALASACRFRDCRHGGEPGCAVGAAERNGALPPGRLASWRKLQREQQRLAERQDARLRAAREAKWRSISRSMRHHPKSKRWR